LGLEHFVADAQTIFPSHVSAPDVTDLTLMGVPADIESMFQFPKLSSVCLRGNCRYGDAVPILEKFGHQLQKLYILECDDEVDFMQIFRLCPRLKVLHVDFSIGAINNLELSSLKHGLHCLESLFLISDNACIESRGLLHTLLCTDASPHLKKLALVNVAVTLEEFQQTINDLVIGLGDKKEMEYFCYDHVGIIYREAGYTSFVKQLLASVRFTSGCRVTVESRARRKLSSVKKVFERFGLNLF
jgi:hypothetical protein